MSNPEPGKKLTFAVVSGVTGFVSSVLGIVQSLAGNAKSIGQIVWTVLYYTGHIALLAIGFWLILGGIIASIWNAVKPSPGVTVADRMLSWAVFIPCLAVGVWAGTDTGKRMPDNAPGLWVGFGVVAILLPIVFLLIPKEAKPADKASTPE